MNNLLGFVDNVSKIVYYSQKVYNLIPSFTSTSNSPTSTELLDSRSTLIKLGILWISEKSKIDLSTNTKLLVHDHTVTVLFPEFAQGLKKWGVSVENLESIYVCFETMIGQKKLDPKNARDLLYLEVGTSGLRALAKVYSDKSIKTNDLKYSEAGKDLICCAQKIENWIVDHKIDLGLNKFVINKPPLQQEQKLYDIPIENQIQEQPKEVINSKPFVVFDVPDLFDEEDHVTITNIFKKAIKNLQSETSSGALYLAESLNSYMQGIDIKFQTALFNSGQRN